MADTALLPVDMSKQEKSPPPLTKLVHRKPSSPREFFEKLYGPDTKDTKDTAKDRDAEDGSPSPPLSPDPDLAKTHGHPHHGAGGLAAAAAGGGYHHLNLNNNGPASLVGVAGGGGHPPPPSSSYLPAFPLPPHEVGILNMDNVPFPGGLAAFCKSLKIFHAIKIFIKIFQWPDERGKTRVLGDREQHSARSRLRCWR